MNTFLKNISLYWKCQIIGWCSLLLINGFVLFVRIKQGDIPKSSITIYEIRIIISIFLLFVTTHLIRHISKKLHIFKKKPSIQFGHFIVISLLALTLVALVIFLLFRLPNLSLPWEQNKAPFLIFISVLYSYASILIWWILFYFLFKYFEQDNSRKLERVETKKKLFELEAKALRAQMNPHFIFNCMNSIKSLMQEGEIDKGVTYLTTFSKLIRTLFNNADKKEITLHDEIETCKLYLQLEAMRFDTKFSYSVNVDETIDLKSIYVPALIIQPFIENAIWHGIVPKSNSGNVSLKVNRCDNSIEIIIEDDGIGRESSRQNKASDNIGHQSKGVNLTQSRLELDNILQQRQAKLQIFDKLDEEGKPAGTKVILQINEPE